MTYSSKDLQESLINRPRCPDVLIQKDSELWLYNSKLANIPGVNPVIFHNLDEYTEFLDWRKAQGIKCPILTLQKGYSTQGDSYYQVKPEEIRSTSVSSNVSLLHDANRNHPPYNTNMYPGFDGHNQDIGVHTPLDDYEHIGQTQPKSANALDPNWDPVFEKEAIRAGHYKGNEVYR